MPARPQQRRLRLDVPAWRRPEHTDRLLVHLVAYGAFLAVDRLESARYRPIART
ncbi:MAG: hypothetical protein ACJ736_00635 [Streptomyces sp.]